MAIPRNGKLWPNLSLNENSQQFFCCCLFYDVHLILVDLTQLGTLIHSKLEI